MAAASAVGIGRETAGQTEPKSKTTQSAVLPKRTLGRTGVEVSMLNLGTWRSVGLDRILRFAWANGIRYVDTAKSYGSEPAIGRWLQAMPEVRKDIFLVTKDHPQIAQTSDQATGRTACAISNRLRRSDLHSSCRRQRLHDRSGVAQEQGIQGNRRRDPQVGQGAVRRVFDSSPQSRPRSSSTPPKAGFVDVIMVQNNPWIRRPTTR